MTKRGNWGDRAIIINPPAQHKKVSCYLCVNYDQEDASCLKTGIIPSRDGSHHWEKCAHFKLSPEVTDYDIKKKVIEKEMPEKTNMQQDISVRVSDKYKTTESKVNGNIQFNSKSARQIRKDLACYSAARTHYKDSEVYEQIKKECIDEKSVSDCYEKYHIIKEKYIQTGIKYISDDLLKAFLSTSKKSLPIELSRFFDEYGFVSTSPEKCQEICNAIYRNSVYSLLSKKTSEDSEEEKNIEKKQKMVFLDALTRILSDMCIITPGKYKPDMDFICNGVAKRETKEETGLVTRNIPLGEFCKREGISLDIVKAKAGNKYRIKQNVTEFLFDAKGIKDLFTILSHHKSLFATESEKEKHTEKNDGFLEWTTSKVDYTKQKNPGERSEKIIVANKQSKADRLNLIRAKIKEKSSFPEYVGQSKRLMEHQKAACEIAEDYDKFAFFYDTGTGKTVLSLEIMENKRIAKNIKFLVICPKAIIKNAWMNDQREFYPQMKLLPLSKNISLEELKRINNRFNQIDRESGFDDPLFYENWEFGKTRKEQNEYLTKILLGKAQHYIVNGESFVLDFESYKKMGITGLIVDESAILKNYDSRISRAVREFAEGCEYVYLLSGKPAPNTSAEYFSQMKIVDPETFNMSVKNFRSRFYHADAYGRLTLNKNREGELFEMIAKRSIIVSKEDCINLPDTTHVIRSFELPPQVMQKYDMMCHRFVADFKRIDEENRGKKNVNQQIVAQSKLAVLMKLREITSGFIKESDGTEIDIDRTREQELLALIDEIGNNQIIIWCQFKHEIERLAELLTEMGKSVVTAFSDTKNVDDSISWFKEGYADILIAHPKTLQYGVTLVNCCFAIYYSLSYSYEQYEQSYARIYRKGQENICSYFFLQAEHTIDTDIFKCVMDKKKNVEACEYLLKAVEKHSSRHKG